MIDMQKLMEPCDGRPVIVETNVFTEDKTLWKPAILDGVTFKPTVFKCSHEAASELHRGVIASAMMIARGEMAQENRPTPDQFRFTYVDEVPKEHDVPEDIGDEHLADAGYLIDMVRRKQV